MPPPSTPRSSTWRDLPVGTRAVVRRRLTTDEAAASGHVWTDVVGVVVAVDDDGLRLRRDPARGGPTAGVEEDVPGPQVESVRRLPPRPAARRPRRGRDGADDTAGTDDAGGTEGGARTPG